MMGGFIVFVGLTLIWLILWTIADRLKDIEHAIRETKRKVNNYD